MKQKERDAKERYYVMQLVTEHLIKTGENEFKEKKTAEEINLIKSVYPMDQKTWEFAFDNQSIFSRCMTDVVLYFAKHMLSCLKNKKEVTNENEKYRN